GTVGGLERGADLEVRKARVGIFAGAPGGTDEVEFSNPAMHAARAETTVTSAPVALWTSDVLVAALEPASTIRLDPRPAVVLPSEGFRAAASVDEMRHARDLMKAAGQRVDIDIDVEGLGRRRACPVPHHVERGRRQFVADD